MFFSIRSTGISLALVHLFGHARADEDAAGSTFLSSGDYCVGESCKSFDTPTANTTQTLVSPANEELITQLVSNALATLCSAKEQSRLFTTFIHDDKAMMAIKEHMKFILQHSSVFTSEVGFAFLRAIQVQPESYEQLKDVFLILARDEITKHPEILKTIDGCESMAKTLISFFISYYKNYYANLHFMREDGFSPLPVFNLVVMRMVRDQQIFIPRMSSEYVEAVGEQNLKNMVDASFAFFEKKYGFTPKEMEMADKVFEQTSKKQLPVFELFNKFFMALSVPDVEKFDEAFDATVESFRSFCYEVNN